MGSESLTSKDLEQALIDYFAPPDLSDCFTIADVAGLPRMTRGRARVEIQNGIDAGKIEFVMTYKNVKYFRFVGKMLDKEA